MPQNKSASLRHLTIDKCLANFGRRWTFEDLREACVDALAYEGHQSPTLSTKTLRDDLKFMRSMAGYDAPIETYRDSGTYYYRYSERDFTIRKRPITPTELEAIKDVLAMFQRLQGLSELGFLQELGPVLEGGISESTAVRPVISYQSNEYLRGIENLQQLYKHCRDRHVLRLEYHSFRHSEPLSSIFHPWFLKQYNSRWFLFGFDEELDGLPVVIKAIDRIVGYTHVPELEFKECPIDWSEYFDDIVGVSKPHEKEVSEVELVFSKDRAPYIETKPIHPSQRSRRLEDGRLKVNLKLIVNLELKQVLYSFGPDLLEWKGVDLPHSIGSDQQI